MRYLLALLALLVASPALATSSQTKCQSTETESKEVITEDRCIAWRFTADNEDSNAITFRSPTGLICFDPHTGAAGAGTSEVMIWMCPTGAKPAANFGYTCHEILDASLTGLIGAAGTQNACVRVGAGTYFAEVTTAPSSENSVVYFQGEGD